MVSLEFALRKPFIICKRGLLAAATRILAAFALRKQFELSPCREPIFVLFLYFSTDRSMNFYGDFCEIRTSVHQNFVTLEWLHSSFILVLKTFPDSATCPFPFLPLGKFLTLPNFNPCWKDKLPVTPSSLVHSLLNLKLPAFYPRINCSKTFQTR